jgi:NADH-quinone oxidoreductase subunit J
MLGSEILFFIVAGLLVLSSLLVIFQRNVVHCAIALVAALFLVAILFLMLNAPMVGVLQILVYAGAIMVLFLFVIMFLNPGPTEQRRVFSWGLSSLGAVLLAMALTFLLSNGRQDSSPISRNELFGTPEQLARTLFTDFVLPFEIASVLLLVAIVGAVVLAKRER